MVLQGLKPPLIGFGYVVPEGATYKALVVALEPAFDCVHEYLTIYGGEGFR
jgi:hypothetical protein